MPRREWTARGALTVLAGATAALLLGNAAVQGIGSVLFWQPCRVEGYGSDVCAYLQYEAPLPWWIVPLWFWVVEVGLAVAVLVLARAVRVRVTQATLALLFVLLSSILVDYVLTPAINGGYVSADSPPGLGLIGAATMAVAGGLTLAVAVPRRDDHLRSGAASALVG